MIISPTEILRHQDTADKILSQYLNQALSDIYREHLPIGKEDLFGSFPWDLLVHFKIPDKECFGESKIVTKLLHKKASNHFANTTCFDYTYKEICELFPDQPEASFHPWGEAGWTLDIRRDNVYIYDSNKQTQAQQLIWRVEGESFQDFQASTQPKPKSFLERLFKWT